MLADETCKIFLKGKSKEDFNDFVCTDFRLEEKVRKILKLYCYTKEIMNNDNLKMQVKSIMGQNEFPGTPLFCQYGQHYGLVGIQSSHRPRHNAGNELYFKKDRSKRVKIENYRLTNLKWDTLHN